MPQTNITALQDINPIQINVTELNGTPLEVITNVQNTTKDTAGSGWWEFVSIILFLYLIYLFYRKDDQFLLDITRSILISAVWSFFISTAMLLSGWVETIFPLIWFSSITIVAFAGVMKLKAKGS